MSARSDEIYEALISLDNDTDRCVAELLAGHEAKLSELASQTKGKLTELAVQLSKMAEYKDQVSRMLNDVRALDNSIANNVDSFIQATNNALNEVVRGVTITESRVNGMWNTVNTLIEFFADYFERPDTLQTGTGGAERFKAQLLAVGVRLLDAAITHRRSERSRIVSEQRAGNKPSPMTPVPESVASSVVRMVHDKVEAAVKQDDHDADRG